MREILFRGKTLYEGEWITGYLSKEPADSNYYIQPVGKNICDVVNPETVGQYTGLLDKNGNKIFEGDILESDSERFVVDWDDEFSGFYLTDVNPRHQGVAMFANVADDGYIIGNVHDNPEMLNNETLAEFQPVIHAKWEISSDGYYPYCKKCNARPENGKMTKYCPSCGAKMDGD